MLPLQNFRMSLPQMSAAIELYFAPYKQVIDHFAPETCWLQPQELARAQEFSREADRLRFVAARLLLRCRLGQMAIGVAPRDWQLALNPHGKPFVCGPKLEEQRNVSGNVTLPSFNLAHSGDYVGLAFSPNLDSQFGNHFELGLDIEQQGRRRSNIAGIAQMLFSQQQQQQLHYLAQQDDAAAQQLFLQFWCSHEALTKLKGTGLLAPNVGAARDPNKSKQNFACTEGQFIQPSAPAAGRYFWALCWRKPVAAEIAELNNFMQLN